jgi:hypothetical protein
MEIHSNLRTRLLEVTSAAVSQMRVEKGLFLESDTTVRLAEGDKALPTALTLGETISDHPFSGFVVAHLQERLFNSFE